MRFSSRPPAPPLSFTHLSFHVEGTIPYFQHTSKRNNYILNGGSASIICTSTPSDPGAASFLTFVRAHSTSSRVMGAHRQSLKSVFESFSAQPLSLRLSLHDSPGPPSNLRKCMVTPNADSFFTCPHISIVV